MKYSLKFTSQQNEKLLSLALSKDFFLVGGTSKSLYKYTYDSLFKSILVHSKSIRSVTINLPYYGCASYDSKATILKNNEILDVIEGPETEIKKIAFSSDNSEVAVSTRGKTVWILKNKNDEFEIESILEDHTQDVKGVKFYGAFLLTYGYDNTIKVYEKNDGDSENDDFDNAGYNTGWELIQSIDLQCTVWDVLMYDNTLACVDNTGILYLFNFDGLFYLKKQIQISNYPILSICKIKNYLGFILNRSNICIIDFDMNIKLLIEKVHMGEINCIDFCDENNILASIGDDGKINIYELDF